MSYGTQYESILTVTGNTTVLVTNDVILVDTSSGAVTITLYDPQGQWGGNIWAGNNQGGRVCVMKTDTSANAVTVATTAGSIFGPTSLTKQYQSALFEADGVSKWLVRTYVGGSNIAQSAGKTTITGQFAPYGTKTALTPGATVAIDATLGDFFTLTPGEDETLNVTGGIQGQRLFLEVITSGTTSRTLTFGTNFKSTGTLATGTTTAKTFIVAFLHDGTNFVETSRTAAM